MLIWTSNICHYDSLTRSIIVIFYFEESQISSQKTISVRKVSPNAFDISQLKKKMGKLLKYHETEADSGSRRCRSLGCRCITAESDFEHYSNLKSNGIGLDINQKRLENDVSNICLKLLRFLILDGDANRDRNLELLFQQSLNFLDKQRGPDDIMVDVFYPIYTTIFQPVHRNLEKGSNFSDPFIYDQRIFGSDGTIIFNFDANEDTCENVDPCRDTLGYLSSTWRKVINIMSFDWNMGIGSMVANFHYLMMTCNKDQYWLQTNEQMWAPNAKSFQAPCQLNKDTQGFNELIKTITEAILNLPFGGVYLNDLVGYLGYSSTFDLSSLQGDKYMYNTRNLHPIQGMDTFVDMQTLIDEGWKQCNYLATYQNWAKLTSDLDKIKDMGKCNINGSSISILVIL